MKTDIQKQRDPVCKMWVEGNIYQQEYSDMHFAFCSAQCLERFNTNPHLYIGYPGERAPVQEGETSMKRRQLELIEVPGTRIASHIIACLQAMMGVEKVSITGAKLRITYDLLQATARQIESVIEGAGGRLSRSGLARLRYALIEIFETMELDSRELPPQHRGHRH